MSLCLKQTPDSWTPNGTACPHSSLPVDSLPDNKPVNVGAGSCTQLGNCFKATLVRLCEVRASFPIAVHGQTVHWEASAQLCGASSWTQRSLWVPSNAGYSVILRVQQARGALHLTQDLVFAVQENEMGSLKPACFPPIPPAGLGELGSPWIPRISCSHMVSPKSRDRFSSLHSHFTPLKSTEGQRPKPE